MPNIKMNPPQVCMCSPSWTLLPPPSPFHPSGSSQCTSPKHPVLCIKPGLATRFIHDILQLFIFNMATIYFPHLLTFSSFWLSFFLNYDCPLSSHLISSSLKDWQCRSTYITVALKKNSCIFLYKILSQFFTRNQVMI